MLTKFLKIPLTFLLIFLTTSCVRNWYKPMGYVLFRQLPPGGSPGFNLGWNHGCESGLGSQFGGAFYMTFYTWKRDQDIAMSEPDIPKIRARYKSDLKDVKWEDINDVKKNFSDYNTIFWTAHTFCRHAVLGILQTANMHPKLPGEERFIPGEHNIGSMWKLNGKGDTRIGSTGLW
jgi:hypothetical protein